MGSPQTSKISTDFNKNSSIKNFDKDFQDCVACVKSQVRPFLADKNLRIQIKKF